MHSADSGTHLSQRCQERLHLLRIPHDYRKRYCPNFLYSAASSWFRAPCCTPAPHERPPGLRESFQEVANPGISPAAPNNSFSILPQVFRIALGKSSMVKHDLRPRSLFHELKSRNRVNARAPTARPPGLDNTFIRHKLDLPLR